MHVIVIMIYWRQSSRLSSMKSINDWYLKANDYWEKAEQNYNGVLSGYGELSDIDIEHSSSFLQRITSLLPGLALNSVIDCGAGIGRIAKELLCHHFKWVDIVDQSSNFIETARKLLKGTPQARNFYVCGLQQFNFASGYDCIWIQWVLTHLSDEDAIRFLQKCKSALNPNGVIVVKENFSADEVVIDQQDCSTIRRLADYRYLFDQAGLHVVLEDRMERWPADLYEVNAYALS